MVKSNKKETPANRTVVKIEKPNKTKTNVNGTIVRFSASQARALVKISLLKDYNQSISKLYEMIEQCATNGTTRLLVSNVIPSITSNKPLLNMIRTELREQNYKVEDDDNPYVKWD